MGLFDRFKVPSVSATEARELVRSGAQLIDVRETGEWNAGHARRHAHPDRSGRRPDEPFQEGQGHRGGLPIGQPLAIGDLETAQSRGGRSASQAACVLGSPSADK